MEVYNLPVECDLSIYDIAIREYVSIVSTFPEVKSIAQIGNVGIAGISDIDLIIYLDDTHACNNNYSLYQVDKKYHEIIMHDVFIIPYRLMSKSFLITSIFETKAIYGNQLHFDEESREMEAKKNLILLNDICIASLLSEYEKWIRAPKKDIKLIIARLNSLKYPIILLENISEFYHFQSDAKDIYRGFVQEFTEFRKQWFSRSNEANTKALLEYIRTASTIIAPQLIRDVISINKILHFFNYENTKAGLKYDNEIFEADSTLFLNLLQYSRKEGPVSKHIKDSLVTDINIHNIDSDYLVLLNTRIDLINECYVFLNKNKIRYGELWTFGTKKHLSLFERSVNKLKRISRKIKLLLIAKKI